MVAQQQPADSTEHVNGVRVGMLLLAVTTGIAVYLCWLLLVPFLQALTWALAVAVATHPLNQLVKCRLGGKNLAAAISVLLVAIILIGPGVPLVRALAHEAGTAIKQLQDGTAMAAWSAMIDHHSWLAPGLDWFQSNVDLGQEATRLGAGLTSWISSFIADSIWVFIQLFVSLFTLFFLFRDGDEGLVALRPWLPLSAREADELLGRVSDTIYATLYGHLAASMAQGLLGGLMFWWLGLPAPLLWGSAMALLAIVPVLGAFVIWIPAALLLILKGSWIKAVILLLWGNFVVGLVDNLIYPILVGKRVRLHTVLVFFAIMGGLFTFGVSGIILGPVIMAVTIELLKIWRRRIQIAK